MVARLREEPSLDDTIRMLEALDPNAMLDIVLSQSVHDKPALSLADELSRLTVRELRELARNAGMTGSISKMNKRTLVNSLFELMDAPPAQLLSLARSFGTSYLKCLRQLCEAGGHIEVPIAEFKSLKQVPVPHPPLSLLYDWDDTLHSIMPQELFAKLKDVDWDKELKDAEPIERALAYLDVLVDLRGIVPLREAIYECTTHTTDAPGADDIKVAILNGASGPQSGFACVTLYDMKCLVHGILFDYLKDDDPDDWDYVEGLFVSQEEYPARPLTDELLQAGSVPDMLRETPPGKALAALLEKGTPSDLPPALFAPTMVMALVQMSRESQRICDFVDILARFDIRIVESDADQAMGLYAQLAARIPQWDRNGWSLRDELCGKVRPQPRIDEDLADILPFVPRS